jgi:hypothetical protein
VLNNIAQLLPLQEELRHPEEIPQMVKYVKSGGRWNRDSLKKYGNKLDPIFISRLEDGTLLLHDGHHRALATLLAGRDFLYSDEYVIEDYTYADYSAIYFHKSYVTPLDLKTECRVADFFDFKKEVMEIYKTNPEQAIQFIRDNPDRYRYPRTLFSLKESADKYRNVSTIAV